MKELILKYIGAYCCSHSYCYTTTLPHPHCTHTHTHKYTHTHTHIHTHTHTHAHSLPKSSYLEKARLGRVNKENMYLTSCSKRPKLYENLYGTSLLKMTVNESNPAIPIAFQYCITVDIPFCKISKKCKTKILA